MSKACIVNSLTKSYDSLIALDSISFEINQGEIFGLIGPNGSGKTTTLRILSTLLKPDQGSAKIFDFDVVKQDSEVRKLISYLPEEAGAYKNLTGFDYLKFVADLYSANSKERINFLDRAISFANLGERIKDKVKTYSKGMARKLLLARALMTNPQLAILDEPTVGLDVLNSLEIRQIIKQFVKAGGTVLLSSHNMLEVEFLSDRVALLKQGKIIETGKVSELKDKYRARNLEEIFFGVAQ
ncbi:MAG: ABC transporter ATP-binding protein [candidate division WOR-3 bacterium]|nr:ABC transporter ATP-binding protein [candidate division WOR-3 bacterium]